MKRISGNRRLIYDEEMHGEGAGSFRRLCEERGIAVTHQRRVLYEVMCTMHGHPSPEEVYAEVRRNVPTISLATVYKNINLFVESGVLREVSLHHGSRRVELATEEHHHAVCSHCKGIFDIEASELGPVHYQERLAGGFLVERYAIDVIGLCAVCQHDGLSPTASSSQANATL